MSNLQCPVCKSDSYINPNIKLYISPCYHKICENCLAYTYQQGQAPCPECGTLLRRINYLTQTFEDLEVEKECKIRRVLQKFYKKTVKDFKDEIEFNDYLENMEDTVFELLDLNNDSEISKRIELMKAESRSAKRTKISDEKIEERAEEIEYWRQDLNYTKFKFQDDVKFIAYYMPASNNMGFPDCLMAYRAYSEVSKAWKKTLFSASEV